MDTVALKNVGNDVFTDKFDGKVYKIKPGATVLVPINIAKHWIGNWDLTGPDYEADLKRAAVRRGGKPPTLEVVEQDDSDDEDDEIAPPTDEEEEYLKGLREGAYYVFPDGERIRKKLDALAYLREVGK